MDAIKKCVKYMSGSILAVLVVIALVYVMVRTGRLHRKFSGQAAALSLQECVELHEERHGTMGGGGYGSLLPYATREGSQKRAGEWQADQLKERSSRRKQALVDAAMKARQAAEVMMG